jgi:PKD repeat protein
LNDSATFKVIVRDTITNQVCESELFGVSVYPPIHIEFVQIRLTCTNGDTINGRTAQVRATASGAFQPDEYHYFWEYPAQIIGDSSLALGLKGHQNYAIAVKDRYGCVARDTFYTQVYPNPVIEIFTDPNDTVYLQNPSVTYSYNNLSIDSIALSTHSWEIIEGDTVFTSELEAPVYRYNSTGEFMAYLTVVNPEGCDTTYATTVTVKPVELYIPNVFTPGTSPGVNDFFEVTTKEIKDKGTTAIETLQRFYENSRLVVFNRLGKKVFEADNYDNKWDGDNLPDGVYYYVLECHGAKSTDVFKGSVTIIRGN